MEVLQFLVLDRFFEAEEVFLVKEVCADLEIFGI